MKQITIAGSREFLPVPGAVDTAALRQEIADTEAALSRVMELYQIAAIPFSQVQERAEALRSRKLLLQNQIEQAEQVFHTNCTLSVENFHSVLHSGTLAEKRLLVASMIQTIRIDGRSVEIEWRI